MKKKKSKKESVVEVKKNIKKKDAFDILIYKIWCKRCGICVAFCPNEVLGFDKAQNLVVLNSKACIGCGLCELRCPDYAIEILEKKEA